MIVHDDSYLIWNLLKTTHWHNVIDAFTRKQLASFIHDFVVKLSTSELLLFGLDITYFIIRKCNCISVA